MNMRMRKKMFVGMMMIVVMTAAEAVVADDVVINGGDVVVVDDVVGVIADDVIVDDDVVISDNVVIGDDVVVFDDVVVDDNVVSNDVIVDDDVVRDDVAIDDDIVIGDIDVSTDNVVIDTNEVIGANIPAASDTASGTGYKFSFDAGLAIGGVPLFEAWQKTLPARLEDFDLTRDSYRPEGDAGNLTFRVTEPPQEFNFMIPFGVSVHRVSDDYALSLGLSLRNFTKQYQAALFIDNDSAGRRIDLHESLSFSLLTFEAAYSRVIPPSYFSITGSSRTSFRLAFGVSPLTYFSRNWSCRRADEGGSCRRANEDDERIDTDERMDKIVEVVRNRFTELNANGVSFSWRAGITTLRSRGIEVGLYYGGTYSSNFTSNGGAVMSDMISRNEDEQENPLSFVTNQIEFRVSFSRSLNRRTANDADIAVNKNIGHGDHDDNVTSENLDAHVADGDVVIDDAVIVNDDVADDILIDNNISDENISDNAVNENTTNENLTDDNAVTDDTGRHDE